MYFVGLHIEDREAKQAKKEEEYTEADRAGRQKILGEHRERMVKDALKRIEKQLSARAKRSENERKRAEYYRRVPVKYMFHAPFISGDRMLVEPDVTRSTARDAREPLPRPAPASRRTVHEMV